MKKINRFLMIYMVVITVLCICMCYLACSAKEKKDNLKEVRSQITTTAEKKQTKAVKKVKATYSLKILDGSLAVINNKTKEVFEYTDMKLSLIHIYLPSNKITYEIARHGAAGSAIGTGVGVLTGLIFCSIIYRAYQPKVKIQMKHDRTKYIESYGKDVYKRQEQE